MWTRGFISLCCVVFFIGLITGPVHLFFPVYIENAMGENPLFAGLLRSIPIALGGITALIGGTLSDRFGRKPTLLIGMTGAVVIGGLFTTQIPLLICGFLCYEGIASGLKTAGGQSYLISSVTSERLGFATGLYFISRTLGNALGSAIAGEIISRYDYTVFGNTAILFTGIVFIGACFLLPRVKQNTIDPLRRKQSILKSTLNIEKYLNLCKRYQIQMLIGLRVFPTYYWGTVNLLMPILINQLGGEKATGYYGTLSLSFAFICQFVTGKICDRVGHRLPAFVTNIIVTLMASALIVYHNSLFALEFYGILGTGAAWALSTTIPRFINEFTDAHEKGHGVGITHLAWSTGFLLGYLASGILVIISVKIPFIIAGFFLLCSTYITYKLWHTNKH